MLHFSYNPTNYTEASTMLHFSYNPTNYTEASTMLHFSINTNFFHLFGRK